MKEKVELKQGDDREKIISDHEAKGQRLEEDMIVNEVTGYTDPVTHDEHEYDDEGNIIETTTIVDKPKQPIIEKKHYLVFTDEAPEERPSTLQEQINQLKQELKSLEGTVSQLSKKD